MKKQRYEVTIKRQVEHVAIIEVDARSSEEAEGIALNEVDEANSRYWREGDVISQSAKVKELR